MAEGWTYQQYDLRLSSVSRQQFAAFLNACHAAGALVRVEEIRLSAIDGKPGLLQAQLVLGELVSPAGAEQ